MRSSQLIAAQVVSRAIALIGKSSDRATDIEAKPFTMIDY